MVTALLTQLRIRTREGHAGLCAEFGTDRAPAMRSHMAISAASLGVASRTLCNTGKELRHPAIFHGRRGEVRVCGFHCAFVATEKQEQHNVGHPATSGFLQANGRGFSEFSQPVPGPSRSDRPHYALINLQ
jgi:hypothetical protein